MSPSSKHIRIPAVIHDYIYENLCELHSKEEADYILFEAMGCVPSPATLSKRRIVHQAVRFGGKGGW